MQCMNSKCNIDVPQAIGDASNGCLPQQLTYTNTMLSSVNPIPLFPATTLNTAIGQQYAAENKTNVVRTALSQLALNEATQTHKQQNLLQASKLHSQTLSLPQLMVNQPPLPLPAASEDMQAVLNLVWNKLLPAMSASPVATDDESRKKLETTLAGLTLRPLQGSGSPAKVANKTYTFPANERKLEAITLQSDDKGENVTLLVKLAGVEQKIECGRNGWKKGRMAYGMLSDQPAAASGAWTADDTFKARICFYETPFIVTLSLKFKGDELLVDSQLNLGFGSTNVPQLVGKVTAN